MLSLLLLSLTTSNPIVDQTLDSLAQTPQLHATIVQRADFNGRQFETAGDYVAATGGQFRLRLESALLGQSLRYESICDGRVLWIVRELRSVPAGSAASEAQIQQSIERYDCDRLRDALANLTPERRFVLRGLPGLVSGLAKNFDLAATRSPSSPQIVLRGDWQTEQLAALGIDRSKSSLTLPDSVELTIDADTAIPVRLLYPQNRPAENGLKTAAPILLMELRDIDLTTAVDPAVFDYIPPTGVTYVDRTRELLDGADSTTE